MWNKAYVTAHYPLAYASQWSNGRRVKTWNVHWGEAFAVRNHLPRRVKSAKEAWRRAAEVIEHATRHKPAKEAS